MGRKMTKTEENEALLSQVKSLNRQNKALKRRLTKLQNEITGKYSYESMEVIDYLNLKTITNYQHSHSSMKDIILRLNEGFTVDDMCLVIDAKVAQWLGSKQAQYLRPITLFSASKFEGYLQSAKRGDHEKDRQFATERKTGAQIVAESAANAFRDT